MISRPNLDTSAAIACVLGGAIVVALSTLLGFGQYGLGFAFIIGPIIYIIHQRVSSGNTPTPVSSRTYRAGTAAYVVVFLIALISLVPIGQERPTVHFVAVTIAVTLLIVDILYHETCTSWLRTHVRLAMLTKLIAITLVYRAGRFFVAGTIPGNDVHSHLELATYISDTGSLPALSDPLHTKYASSPVFHSLIALLQFVGLSEVGALFTVVCIFGIVTILFGYLITITLSTPQAGLFAALFISVSDVFILRGVTSITPSILVIMFVMIAVYSFFQSEFSSTPAKLIPSLAVFAAIFTQHLATVVMVVTFVAILFGSVVVRQTGLIDPSNQDQTVHLSSLFAIAAAIGMVTHWIITRVGPQRRLFDEAVYRVMGVFFRVSESGGASTYSFGDYGIISNLLYNIGYSMLIALGLIGLLIWLRPEYRTEPRLAVIGASGALLIMIYPLTAIGFSQFLIPHRILAFLVLFFAVFAGVACTSLVKRSNSSRLIVGGVLGLLVFMSLTTPYIAQDSPQYSEDRVYRTELTDQELDAHIHATSIADDETSVYIDPLVRERQIQSEQRYRGHSYHSDIREYPANETWENESVVVIRDMYQSEGYQYGAPGTFGAGESAVYSPEPLAGCNRTMIYSNSGAEVYRLPDGCGP